MLMLDERFEFDPSELVLGDASSVCKMLMAIQGDSQRSPVNSRPELRYIAGLPREPDGEIVETMIREEVTNGTAVDV